MAQSRQLLNRIWLQLGNGALTWTEAQNFFKLSDCLGSKISWICCITCIQCSKYWQIWPKIPFSGGSCNDTLETSVILFFGWYFIILPNLSSVYIIDMVCFCFNYVFYLETIFSSTFIPRPALNTCKIPDSFTFGLN